MVRILTVRVIYTKCDEKTKVTWQLYLFPAYRTHATNVSGRMNQVHGLSRQCIVKPPFVLALLLTFWWVQIKETFIHVAVSNSFKSVDLLILVIFARWIMMNHCMLLLTDSVRNSVIVYHLPFESVPFEKEASRCSARFTNRISTFDDQQACADLTLLKTICSRKSVLRLDLEQNKGIERFHFYD